MYRSYKKEFLLKASPSAINEFRKLSSASPMLPTDKYMDTAFKRMDLASTYNHMGWEKISSETLGVLRKLQQNVRF